MSGQSEIVAGLNHLAPKSYRGSPARSRRSFPEKRDGTAYAPNPDRIIVGASNGEKSLSFICLLNKSDNIYPFKFV